VARRVRIAAARQGELERQRVGWMKEERQARRRVQIAADEADVAARPASLSLIAGEQPR
jgi:hypothetical protein